MAAFREELNVEIVLVVSRFRGMCRCLLPVGCSDWVFCAGECFHGRRAVRKSIRNGVWSRIDDRDDFFEEKCFIFVLHPLCVAAQQVVARRKISRQVEVVVKTVPIFDYLDPPEYGVPFVHQLDIDKTSGAGIA